MTTSASTSSGTKSKDGNSHWLAAIIATIVVAIVGIVGTLLSGAYAAKIAHDTHLQDERRQVMIAFIGEAEKANGLKDASAEEATLHVAEAQALVLTTKDSTLQQLIPKVADAALNGKPTYDALRVQFIKATGQFLG